MKETIEFPAMATVRDAAAKSGLAVYRIRQLCKSGAVGSISCGNKILVNLGSLAAYMNTSVAQSSEQQADPNPAACAGIRRIEE